MVCCEKSEGPARGTGGLQLPHSKQEVDALLKALSSRSSSKILAALPKASGILRQDVKEKIESCLSHADPMVRDAAFEVVLPCEVVAGYPRLAERLSADFPGKFSRGYHGHQGFDPNGELHDLSGPVLMKFEAMGEWAIPVLAKKLESENPEIRDIAVYLMAKAGSAKAVPHLKMALSDSAQIVRDRAMAALRWFEIPEVLDVFYDLRTHEDRYLVYQAGRALSWHNDERALEVWRIHLFERGGVLSEDELVWNLCRFDSRKAIPILIQGTGPSNPEIRKGCAAVLKKITHQDFGTDQARWENWWVASGAGDHGIGRILGEQLLKTKSHLILEEIVREGDLNAVPFVLATYGEVRNEAAYYVSNPALANLAAHIILPEWERFGPTHEMPTPSKEQWSRWFQENAHRLPARSPLSVATNPLRMISAFATAGGANTLAVDDGLLFAGGSDLEVFDIRDLTHPARIGRYRIDEQGVEQMEADNGRLWISTHQGGLYLYEYNKAGDIRFVVTLTHGAAMKFMVKGPRLLCFGRHLEMGSGAKLFDISQPAHPILLDFHDWIALSQHSLSGEGGFFTMVDWSGSEIKHSGGMPIDMRFINTSPRGVAFVDDARFYCMGEGSLTVRDLDSGKLLGMAPTPQHRYRDANAFILWKHFAIASMQGIVIYDVSTPSEIKVVSHTTPKAGDSLDCRALCVTRNHLIGACGGGMIRVYELPAFMREDKP